MKLDVEELRRRMATRSYDELVAVVTNAERAYTDSAVDVARIELAARKASGAGAGEVSDTTLPPGDSLARDFVPAGVRIAWWLAVMCAIAGSLLLLLGLCLTATGAIPWLGAWTFVSYGGAVLISWWIVVAIKRQHPYGRVLLVAMVAAWIVNRMIVVAVTVDRWVLRDVDPLDLAALWRFAVQQHADYLAFLNEVAVPCLVLCYFALSKKVAAYFSPSSHSA